MLRATGLSQVKEDEILNASMEDAARRHSAAVTQLHEANLNRVRGNAALRESIKLASVTVVAFDDSDRRMRRKLRIR